MSFLLLLGLPVAAQVVVTTPTNGSSFTATASVTLGATVAPSGVTNIDFYANSSFLGNVTDNPATLTATGIAAGSYALTAVATDGSGLSSTSAPVNINVLPDSGLPYGLTSRLPVKPFLNLSTNPFAPFPDTLSQTGVFTNTAGLAAAPGLIPYAVIQPKWSDGAISTHWIAVPWSGGVLTPNQQIGFAPTGYWTFPNGTVFVEHLELPTNQTNPAAPKRRLETRLLAYNTNDTVFAATYKWRPDNSDADLLTYGQTEDIVITNAQGTWIQTWLYPSPQDCLDCHNAESGHVEGVKTRQMDRSFTYPATGQMDNQLRTLNRLGLLYPAIDEKNVTNYTCLVAVTNPAAKLADRARTYLDANCASCHFPGGDVSTFDARYDTPLAKQNLINGVLNFGNFDFDNAHVVVPKDIWRSILYYRLSILDMPELGSNLIDTNSLAIIAAWINSLSGTPALPPPVIAPAGGTFTGSVSVTLQPPTNTATVYYTLDGSVPTTASFLYTGPFLLTNSAILSANAYAASFNRSIAPSELFVINPPLSFIGPVSFSNGVFQIQLSCLAAQSYVFQASTDLLHWVPLATNKPASSPFLFTDPSGTNSPRRFYRALEGP